MRLKRWHKPIAALAVLAIVAIAARQGAVISKYGVTGWLEGEGPTQTEWQVRAALLAMLLLVALVVGLLWRAGESLAGWLYVRRMVRAVRRERRGGDAESQGPSKRR